MKIEVVYALPNAQGYYVGAVVPVGFTVLQALTYLDFFKLHPEVDLTKSKVGIFGKLVQPTYVLNEGDRVEVYRPIYVDPKVARLNAVKLKRAK